MKIAQKVDLVTCLTSDATHESHMRSTCWKLKSQVLGCISWVTSWLKPSCEWPAKMPYVYENASMSVYPHACDDMLHDSLGVI